MAYAYEPASADAAKISWLAKTDAAEEIIEPELPIIDVRCPPPHPTDPLRWSPQPLLALGLAAPPPGR